MKEENVKSEYQRKVDKSLIPTCNIMGVNIAAINMNWLLKYIDENLSDIKGDYICVSNVHTTVTSYEDAPARVNYPEALGLRHLAFKVKSVDDMVKELNAKGIATEPVRLDDYTGKKMTFFHDPDNLPLEIHE